jgi:hypothetical protein
MSRHSILSNAQREAVLTAQFDLDDLTLPGACGAAYNAKACIPSDGHKRGETEGLRYSGTHEHILAATRLSERG